MGVGRVEGYPCDCQGDGHTTCWIVRHPKLIPPVSFPTKQAAEAELARLQNKMKPDPKYIAAFTEMLTGGSELAVA